jgi:hypothetical protein
VPDVKAALARFEKYNVEVFKPLGVASNETIPVPEGKVNIVPGFAALYKQIAMIKVRVDLYMLTTGSGWLFHRVGPSDNREALNME